MRKQVDVIIKARHMTKQNTLSSLPTGFGKSMC